jgi:hypothetical protein
VDAEQDTPTVPSDRADVAAPPERHGAAAPPPDPAGAVPGEDAVAADAAAIPPAAGVPAGSSAVPLVDYVPDVTAETSGWLREARALADRAGLEEVVTVLDELSAGRGRPTFRIAVVGEFNRGKSTLLNTLLGRDLLPTGPLPVTRIQVAVRAGVEDALTVEWPDGRREIRRPDAPDAWHGLAFAPGESDTVAGTTDQPGTADPAGSGAPHTRRSCRDPHGGRRVAPVAGRGTPGHPRRQLWQRGTVRAGQEGSGGQRRGAVRGLRGGRGHHARPA